MQKRGRLGLRPDTSLSRFFTPPLLLRRLLFRPEFLIEHLGLAKLLCKGSVARSQLKLMAHLILICAENNTDVWILGKSLNHSLLPLCSWARGLLMMYTKSRWKKRKEKFLIENHQLPKARILTINSKLYPHQTTLLHEERSIKFSLTFSLNVKLISYL